MPSKLEQEEVTLTQREMIALKFIKQYTDSNALHRPPTHVQLLDHLNAVLPKQKDGRPALVSKQQTHRLAISLRAKGMLVDVGPGDKIPNMVLTADARKRLDRLARNSN